jgi:hypothetical protein
VLDKLAEAKVQETMGKLLPMIPGELISTDERTA